MGTPFVRLTTPAGWFPCGTIPPNMSRLLRIIRNDFHWLATGVGAIGAILVIGLSLGVLYLWKEWWLAPITTGPWWARRVATRLQDAAAILIIIFICYIASLVDRARQE